MDEARPKRGLAGASLLMMGSTGVLNIAMVVYWREMSVRLGTGYADLAALTGIMNVTGVLFTGVGTWLTRDFAAAGALGGEQAALKRFFRLTPGVAMGALALAGSLAVAAPIVARELALASPGLVLAAAVVVALGLLLILLRSLLQGLHRFGALGSSYLLEAAGRAVIPAVAASSYGVAGALWGTALVTLLAGGGALPVFWVHRKGRVAEAQAEVAAPMVWTTLARDSAALGLFSVVGFLDILVYKHAHGAADPAGVAFYSRAALVGKSLLYAASAFNLVALPAISAAWAHGRDPRPLLGKFFLAMLAVEGVTLGCLWAFTNPMLKLLLGNAPDLDLAALAPVVRYFSLAVLPLALYQLLLFHSLATHAKGVVPMLLVVVVLYGAALGLWHADPMQMIACLAGAATVMLAGGWALVARHSPPPRHGAA